MRFTTTVMNETTTKIFPYLERLLDGEEVEWKTLGEVAEFKRGQTIMKKTAQTGVYPVISGGQQPAYYIDQYNRTGQTITVAGSGAYAGFVMFWDEPIFVSDAFSIKTDEEVVLPRYVFHFLLNKQEVREFLTFMPKTWQRSLYPSPLSAYKPVLWRFSTSSHSWRPSWRPSWRRVGSNMRIIAINFLISHNPPP